ncbi:hypothetical protein B0H10DRAFT_1949996 [Mycena sp. CBHHK59/15]|nr:hypothetical protein B0H10DRAFT_1949996 [Mycena sp. CBHHK59/15]
MAELYPSRSNAFRGHECIGKVGRDHSWEYPGVGRGRGQESSTPLDAGDNTGIAGQLYSNPSFAAQQLDIIRHCQQQCAGKGGSWGLKVGGSKGWGCCAALEVGGSVTAAKGGSRAVKACGLKGSAGKVRFGSGSGPFALNTEPEPRVRFRPLLNPEPEPVFSQNLAHKGSAFEHHPLNTNTEPNFVFSSVRFRFEPIPEPDLATTIERAGWLCGGGLQGRKSPEERSGEA